MLNKEDIIKQIQECSKELEDKTPSEKVFYEYAGVKLYDLHKHGWSNYRELVLEAGLTPNKFDKTKYSHEQLCKLFIEVIREKGKWPTRGELDVKHHKDYDFPESGTFYDKLGLIKTGDLARTILEHVKDKQEYNDITNLCNSIFEKMDKLSDKDVKRRKQGWVYLFKHGHYNQYRIGQTYDILRRGSEIRIQLPERAILIHTIETVDPIGVETYWLRRFQEKKMNADWFNLSRDDVAEFKHWKRIV